MQESAHDQLIPADVILSFNSSKVAVGARSLFSRAECSEFDLLSLEQKLFARNNLESFILIKKGTELEWSSDSQSVTSRE